MAEHYKLQVEKLQELENMSVKGGIDIYYGDETHVCSEGYVPYGWQFPGEDICFLSEKSYEFNCFWTDKQTKPLLLAVTQQNINTGFELKFWRNSLSKYNVQRITFIVLDNAHIFSTFEYCGNALAKAEERMARFSGLSE